MKPEHPPVPRGLAWRPSPDGLGGALHWPRGGNVFLTVIALWNMGLVWMSTRHPMSLTGTLLIALGMLVTLVPLVRGVINRTRVWFEHGRLHCVSGPLWPRTAIDHPVSDIARFLVQPRGEGKPKRGHAVFLVTRMGAFIELPFELDGTRGTFAPDAVSDARAAYVAEFLDRALDVVRREGGSYRVSPAAVFAAPDDAPDADDAVLAEPESGQETRVRRNAP